MGQYINLTQTFFNENQGYVVDVNQLHAVRALNGMLVCDANTINDFPDLFEVEYDFLEVDLNFYNQYNGMVLIPEKYYLFVRTTNDNKYVVEESMRWYFPNTIPPQAPILKYKLKNLQDFYVNLEWKDFDHSNDIV